MFVKFHENLKQYAHTPWGDRRAENVLDALDLAVTDDVRAVQEPLDVGVRDLQGSRGCGRYDVSPNM